MRRLGALTALLLLAAEALRLGAPDPRSLGGAVRRPQQWVGLHGADQAVLIVTAGLAWAALAWLGVGVVVTLAGELPGLAGRVGAALADAVLPRTLRHGLALALGAGLAVGGTSPALAGPTNPAPTSATATAEASTDAVTGGGVALDWPLRPPAAAGPAPTPPQHAPAVVVRPGDSLWRIAAARLGPQVGSAEIAAAVRAWYTTNRDVIGADPDLIRPGQQLLAPDAGEHG